RYLPARPAASSGAILPRPQELFEMRLFRSAQHRAHTLDLLRVPLACQASAHEVEAQVDEVCIQHVRLTVTADADDVIRQIRVPDLCPGKVELAGKLEERRDGFERCTAARLVSGEHVHEIDVPPVKAPEVVVVAECGVLLADIPVTRRQYPCLEGQVMENREVEPTSIPGPQVRREALDAVEETLDELSLRRAGIAEAPEAQPIACA